MCRSRSVDEPIEELMVKSSLQAVREADIVVLMVDAQEAQLAHQELKLASYVFENGKALIIVRNKKDLLTTDLQAEWELMTGPYEFLLKKIETITISCKDGVNVGRIVPLIKEVWERYTTNMSPTELTLLFKEALTHTPLFKGGHKLKVFSAKQVAIKPPTIRLNVNNASLFDVSDLAFFENLLRKRHNFRGCPLKFVARTIIPK